MTRKQLGYKIAEKSYSIAGTLRREFTGGRQATNTEEIEFLEKGYWFSNHYENYSKKQLEKELNYVSDIYDRVVK